MVAAVIDAVVGPTLTVKISVVVPTYNRASLIACALASIAEQTRMPDEIIVVDDGSTDDTEDLLARDFPSVKVIRNENSGDLVSRNLGLRAATGDIVAFCDSDDVWEADLLQEISTLWARVPGLTVAYTDFREWRDGQLDERTKFQAAPPGFWSDAHAIGPDLQLFDTSIALRLLRFQPFFPSCMVVNRTAFLQLGGWDEAVSRIIGCDFATTLRVGHAPPVGVVKKPLVRIRKHGGNFSGNTEAMNLGDALILEHVIKTRPELSAFAEAFSASIVERRQHALDSAFARRDFRAVQTIAGLMPATRHSLKQRIKIKVAKLPPGQSRLLADCLSRRARTDERAAFGG